MLPQLGSVAGVYAGLVYTFALVGQAAFARVGNGGLDATPAPASLFSPVGMTQKGQEFRMDTLPMALLQLLSITVGNK